MYLRSVFDHDELFGLAALELERRDRRRAVVQQRLLERSVAPRARNDACAVQRSDALVVALDYLVDVSRRDQTFLDQQRLDCFRADRRGISLLSHSNAPDTVRTDRDARRRRVRPRRPIVRRRRTRPCRDVGAVRRDRVHSLSGNTQPACVETTVPRLSTRICRQARVSAYAVAASSHAIADTESRYRLDRPLVAAILRADSPHDRDRRSRSRRNAIVGRAPSSIARRVIAAVSRTPASTMHGLEPAQPAAVVTVRQIRDRIDPFDCVPEVIDVARRAAGTDEIHTEYTAFPTRMEHRLVRFARQPHRIPVCRRDRGCRPYESTREFRDFRQHRNAVVFERAVLNR